MSRDKKKSWTKDEVLQLIAEWEVFPELWDMKSTLYRNRIKKQNALKTLGAMFHTNAYEINRKIHILRTQFKAEIKKMQMKNDSGASDDAYRTSWEFFSPMYFLLNDRANVTNTSVIENMSNENSLQYDDSQPYMQPYDDSQYIETREHNYIKIEKVETVPKEQTEELQNLASKKRPNNEPDYDRTNNKKRVYDDEPDSDHYYKKAAYVTYKPADDYQIFGDYVASELRNLKSAEIKRKLKLCIQRAVLHAFESDVIHSSNCGAPNTSPEASNTPDSDPLF